MQTLLRRGFLALALLLVGPWGSHPAHAQAPSYLLFDTLPARPMAMSPDGQRLFVANTPDGYLEIFDVSPVNGTLTHAASVQVGLEPVAVAARNDDEVWVANHLSDSVSIVDVSGTPRVRRTLLLGDEPYDIVFAGVLGDRAFVTTAHRGQNSPYPLGEYAQAGIGRADVYVYDSNALGDSLEGDRLTVITLFGEKPRALAVNADGSRVYAAIFHSGNQTTSVFRGLVCPTSPTNVLNETVQPPCTVPLPGGGGINVPSPGGKPLPHKNHAGDAGPEVGIILKTNRDGGNSGQWLDELGRNWDLLVPFDLADQDVFTIDANANPPVEIDTPYAHVGTVNFNMLVHPVSGKVYVSNTDAQNHVRFEGPGTFVDANGFKPGGEPASVRGNLAHTRITVLDPSTGDVLPRHLNKHISYETVPQPADVKGKSLSTPLGMAFSDEANPQTLYVAGFGSGKIGVYDVAEIDADSFVPNATDAIPVEGGGPSGLLVSGPNLYVTSRFDHTVRVIHLATKSEIQRQVLHSPEPQSVIAGRPILYDANHTSSNGEASCASCHIGGDFDGLNWDLGDPDGDVEANGNPFNPSIPATFDPLPRSFHPNKGPMSTQSLRGLENMGPQHWRGDRQGDAAAAFEAFNVAFPGLLGRDEGPISSAEMTAFREFAMNLRYHPNPSRLLNNQLRNPASGPNEANGAALYGTAAVPGPPTDIANTTDCQTCHILSAANGHFGGDGRTIFDGGTQHFKIPHLRNAYQKIGMFSTAGLQVRGSGYLHDGSVDHLKRFLSAGAFNLNGAEEDDVEAFMIVFDTDLAPITGQQVTLDATLLAGTDAADVNARVDLMVQRAGTPFTSQILGGVSTECDLVAHVLEGGTDRTGYLLNSGGTFTPDDGGLPISEATLRAKANVAGQEVTFTCATPGSGNRVALDRDEDIALNGLDNCPGTPNGAGGGTCTLGDGNLLGTPCTLSIECGGGGFCSTNQEDGNSNGVGDACEPTLLPEPGANGLLVGGLMLLFALARRRHALNA